MSVSAPWTSAALVALKEQLKLPLAERLRLQKSF